MKNANRVDPYSGFRDDVQRYKALRSRDVRLAIVAVAALLVAKGDVLPAHLHDLVSMFRSVFVG